MSDKRVLVVYFSRTGNTHRIAEALAGKLNAEIDEVTETRDRSALGGYVGAIIDVLFKRPADILPARHDPANFDLVVIGTPVWASSVSMPIRAYLAAFKDRLPAIGFFLTLGGSGAKSTFAQMQALAGKPPLATCALTERDVKAGTFDARLSDFARALQAG
eukprot:gene20504-21146_t